MAGHVYFSEREGYKPPLVEDIGIRFWGGFVELVADLLDHELLVQQFPISCPDGRGQYACDKDRVGLRFKAEVGLNWPLQPMNIPNTPKAMDAVEFFGQYVSEPKTHVRHQFYGHNDLFDFDSVAGYKKYSARVNGLLRLCGHACMRR